MSGFSTRAHEAHMLTGEDWETIHWQRVKEERMRREAGLSSEAAAAAAGTDGGGRRCRLRPEHSTRFFGSPGPSSPISWVQCPRPWPPCRATPLPDAELVERRGNVAVVNIQGVITRYSSFFSRFYRSQSTPVEVLALEFRRAIESPGIKAVLLNIDSPGGQANGTHEMAEMIYRARQVKPVVAYAGGMACSGAYWLGTSARELVIDAIGEVGSIGAYALYTDWSKADEKYGIKEIEIVSSLSPKKRPDPNSKDGQSQIREELDALVEVFIADVARNRGVSVETVKADFGQGAVIIGQQAVDLGMADRLGSFEEVLADLQDNRSNTEVFFMSSEDKDKARITRDFVAANHPEIAEAFRTEGFQAGKEEGLKAGAQAERARIQAIEDIAVPGHEALVAKAKFQEPVSAEALSMAILKAEMDQRAAAKKNDDADAKVLEGITPGAVSGPESGTDDDAARKQAAGNIAAGGNAGRKKGVNHG